MNSPADTNIDVERDLAVKAAAYHATLDELSDRLDEWNSSPRGRQPATVTRLRKKIDQLRIHIRLLRRSRSGSLTDLQAGIELSLNDIERTINSA